MLKVFSMAPTETSDLQSLFVAATPFLFINDVKQEDWCRVILTIVGLGRGSTSPNILSLIKQFGIVQVRSFTL